MRFQLYNSRGALAFIVGSISVTLLVYGVTTGRNLPQTGQQQAWAEIVELHKRGPAALRAERSNPKDTKFQIERLATFAKAATNLSGYIETHVGDKTQIKYLRAIYRL